jgi:hypothetical protein
MVTHHERSAHDQGASPTDAKAGRWHGRFAVTDETDGIKGNEWNAWRDGWRSVDSDNNINQKYGYGVGSVALMRMRNFEDDVLSLP